MKKIIFTKLIIFASLLSFATSHVINAGNYYYTPSTLTVNVNDTVQWVNDGGWHDVNFDINSQPEIHLEILRLFNQLLQEVGSYILTFLQFLDIQL